MEFRPTSPFICIGGALVDRTYVLKGPAVPGSSNPAEMRVSFGGVARNVAETIARLGTAVSLAAAVGHDTAGDAMLDGLQAAGVDTARVQRPEGLATADYAALIDGGTGALHIAASAMDAAEEAISRGMDTILATIPAGSFVFADANLRAEALALAVAEAASRPFRLALDAVSVAKSSRLPRSLQGVEIIFMNADEAEAFLGRSGTPATQALRLRGKGAASAVVTCGADGAAAADASGSFQLAAMPSAVVDVTGAGDSLIAATLWRLGAGDGLRPALRWGLAAAGLTVGTPTTVHPRMSADFLASALSRMPPP
jgi:pseudouridine kinase